MASPMASTNAGITNRPLQGEKAGETPALPEAAFPAAGGHLSSARLPRLKAKEQAETRDSQKSRNEGRTHDLIDNKGRFSDPTMFMKIKALSSSGHDVNDNKQFDSYARPALETSVQELRRVLAFSRGVGRVDGFRFPKRRFRPEEIPNEAVNLLKTNDSVFPNGFKAVSYKKTNELFL